MITKEEFTKYISEYQRLSAAVQDVNNKIKGLSWLLKMRLYKPFMFGRRVCKSIRNRINS